jgi:hypothetical protein
MSTFAWDSGGGSMFGATTYDQMPVTQSGPVSGGIVNFGVYAPKETTAGADEMNTLFIAAAIATVLVFAIKKRRG